MPINRQGMTTASGRCFPEAILSGWINTREPSGQRDNGQGRPCAQPWGGNRDGCPLRLNPAGTSRQRRRCSPPYRNSPVRATTRYRATVNMRTRAALSGANPAPRVGVSERAHMGRNEAIVDPDSAESPPHHSLLNARMPSLHLIRRIFTSSTNGLNSGAAVINSAFLSSASAAAKQSA